MLKYFFRPHFRSVCCGWSSFSQFVFYLVLSCDTV